MYQRLICFIFTLIFLAGACSKKEPIPPIPPVSSKHGDTLSHNNGQACLICHTSGGPGPNYWVVAGSVFLEDLITPAVNGTVFFWTGQSGTGNLEATLEVDGNGNFYTTASILPGDGLYPQIQGISGNVQYMPIKAPNGNCNSCHGTSEQPIWVK